MSQPTHDEALIATFLADDVIAAPDDATALDRTLDAAVDVAHAERGYVVVETRAGLEILRSFSPEKPTAEEEAEVLAAARAKIDGHRQKHATAAATGGAVPGTDDSLPLDLVAKVVADREIVRFVIVVVRRSARRPGVPSGFFVQAEQRLLAVVARQAAAGFAVRRPIHATPPPPPPGRARPPTVRLPREPGSAPELPEATEKKTGKLCKKAEDALRARHKKIVGKGTLHLELLQAIERFGGSPRPSPILIEGETGTGKEGAARAIHEASGRKGAFVVVNCAAVVETLFESELFGHKKGAFTDAKEDRVGAFEQADGGTIFLDEVGELPPAQQAKLLRVLQERSVVRLGTSTPIKVDFRVVSATNRCLDDMVKAGTFRADLYFRLAVVHLTLPALRDRLEDLDVLVPHVLAELCGEKAPGVSEAAWRALRAHDWRGNVRELGHVLERAIAFGHDPLRDGDLALKPLARPVPRPAPEDETLEQKRARFAQCLEAAEGNIARGARLAGCDRNHFAETLGLWKKRPRSSKRRTD